MYTRWFKYDRDDLCVNKSQFVPVIFEPPCIYTYTHAYSTHCMCVTHNSLRFNPRKMINIANRNLHSKATVTMRGSATLQILRRPFRNAATFCAFEKIREPTITRRYAGNNDRFRTGRSSYKRKWARK
jgi:hypothetical protein